MSAKKTWIILTSGERPIDAISKELQQTGFSIDATLDAIGQVIVKGSGEMKKKALKIEGVTDILAAGDDIHLGPPGSDTTW